MARSTLSLTRFHASRVACLARSQVRLDLPLHAVPVARQVGLDVVEATARVPGVRAPAVRVGRTVVVVARAARVRTRSSSCRASRRPRGRVDLLGDALAGEAADDGADRRADRRADRAGDRAGRGAGGDASGDGARGGADRVRAGRARQRIAVGARAGRADGPVLVAIEFLLKGGNEEGRTASVAAALPDQRDLPRRNRLTMPSRMTAPTSDTSIAGRLKAS